MKNKRLVSFALWGTVALFVIVLMVIVIHPVLNGLLQVDKVEESTLPEKEEPEKAKAMEEILLTALYEQEESGKISAIYIEILHTGSGLAYYMKVPVSAKVTLPTELYKKLQAYSPELPQYFKLENMGIGFSEEYRMTGCNRILSEVLGVTITHYVAANKEGLASWSESLTRVVQKDEPPTEFLQAYRKWLEVSKADLTPADRWVYYESYGKLVPQEPEQVPGAEGVGEYLISTTQAKLRLQEWMRLAELLGK